MRRPRRPLLLVLAATVVLACGCSSDGKTPDCPPLPLYDVRNERGRASAHDELKAAAAQGCLTLPSGFDDDNGGAGAGGSP